MKKVKGRIYDGSEIKTCYIDENLYREHFFPDAETEPQKQEPEPEEEKDVAMQAEKEDV